MSTGSVGEERARQLARANDGAFLAAWLWRLNDIEDRHNNHWRAVHHLPRLSALAAGRMILGSFAHLDDLEFRDDLGAAVEPEQDALWRRIRDEPQEHDLTAKERSVVLGISPSTEYRRRKAAGQTARPGRPRRA